MHIKFDNLPLNKYFYTIKARYGRNNKYELYCRTQIIYGRFIDNSTFEYVSVHNGKVESDAGKKRCRYVDLYKHDNFYIYTFNNYEDAYKTNKIIMKDLLTVPMKYDDYDSKEEIAKKLEKIDK